MGKENISKKNPFIENFIQRFNWIFPKNFKIHTKVFRVEQFCSNNISTYSTFQHFHHQYLCVLYYVSFIIDLKPFQYHFNITPAISSK